MKWQTDARGILKTGIREKKERERSSNSHHW
jgi:hypothetical protein